MSAQVGTLQRTGFPRMIWPVLAIAVVLGAGIATVAVVNDDRTSSQTSAGSQALTAEADRLTAQAERFEASTRSTTADAARWTATAESFGSSGVVALGITTPSELHGAILAGSIPFGSTSVNTPSELRGGLDGSTTGASNGGNRPIGFHPLP